MEITVTLQEIQQVSRAFLPPMGNCLVLAEIFIMVFQS